MSAIFVYVTTATQDEALRIGRTLVDERLAACANVVDGMRTVYRWNDEIREDGETVLILKSIATALPALTRRVKALHSYECPCIAALPVSGGNDSFIAWIAAQVVVPPAGARTA
jgi:periplasmic divalent cation tolerance protein